MKPQKLLTIIFALVFAGKLAAQPYQSIFGDSSTVWRENPVDFCDYFCSDSIYVEKDTVIGAYVYKKAVNYYLTPYGYLREDTVAGKVWFLQNDFSEESLILDFSKNEGDTIEEYPGGPFITVDTVYYVNGRKYIKYNAYPGGFCSDLEYLLVIEGIGSNAGVMRLHNDFFQRSPIGFLFGIVKDGVTEITNEWGLPLDYCTTGIKEEQSLDRLFAIYPNPASNEVSINIKASYKKPLVKIFNAFGSIVCEQALQGNGVHTIAINNLPNGLYFVSLYNDNQPIGNRKLIIAN